AGLRAVSFTGGFYVAANPPGWVVAELAYFDPANGLFGGSQSLGYAFFGSQWGPDNGSSITPTPVTLGPGPYSVTERLMVAADGWGGVNAAMTLFYPPAVEPTPPLPPPP